MMCFRWTVFSLAALCAAASTAAEPRKNPRLLPTQVVSATLARQDAAAATTPAAPVTPHAPVHYRLAGDIWGGTHAGYVYAPGSCDYTPPCVNHLWDGYEQRPLRCYPPQMHAHGCRGSGGWGGCDSCGMADSCGCRTKRAHAWHFGGKMWNCNSCGDIAPSCGCEGYDGKGMAPSPTPASADAPPAPMPEAESDGSALQYPPAPVPDKAARGYRLRGYHTWPSSSMQR